MMKIHTNPPILLLYYGFKQTKNHLINHSNTNSTDMNINTTRNTCM